MTCARPCSLILVAVGLAAAPAPVVAQFDDVAVPAQMTALEFMVGTWSVDGTFRTPDHVLGDRTLWYLTRGGGVTQFDGRTWTAFTSGQSNVADSILTQTTTLAAPFEFKGQRDVRRIQDGFALLIDEGRTSGSTIVFFDTDRAVWVATAFHAPTNGITTSVAASRDELPVFEGRATDRRGERIFRQRFERHDNDHYAAGRVRP